ncbi:MAG: 3-hydroxyisobutyrate dehydrogenase [Bdellovibrionales bacterium]|nr:3-hydroxyisobutyrate dehydrogenase [Bdellovibrionales bacterium]
MSFKKIAFLGLGHMGHPMALNLIKASFDVSLFDLVPEAVAETAKAGGRACKSVEETVKGAEVVITMLPASAHVEDLYLGKGKLLDYAPKGALLIDSSTIAPESARKVASEAAKRGFEMLDAPVSGGTGGAAAGTLSFMIGGPASAFEKAKPVIEKMGKNIFHAGDHGAGQVAKVCNNMLLAIHMIGTSEAINLGVALGSNPKKLSEIMQKSSGGNWSLEKYNPYPGVMENVPSSKNYEGGFGVDLMTKDLGLAQEAALSSRTATPLGNLALNLYRMHSNSGAGKLDFSSILRFLGRKA